MWLLNLDVVCLHLSQFPQEPRDLDKYKSSEWLLKRVAICLSFGFCKIYLKCWNLQIGTKKTKWFICMCFMIVVSSLNVFYTFDIAMPQLSFLHELSYILGCKCHVCGNSFWMKSYIRKHEKKNTNFFWFQVWDLNISNIFYKSENFNWWLVFPVITLWTYTFIIPWGLT